MTAKLIDFDAEHWKVHILAIFTRHFPSPSMANVATPTTHLAMLADVESWLNEHPAARAQPWKQYLYGKQLEGVQEWLDDHLEPDPAGDEKGDGMPWHIWMIDHGAVDEDDL